MDSDTLSSCSSFLGPLRGEGREQTAAEIRRKSPGQAHTGPLATAQGLGHFAEKPSLLTVTSLTIVTGIMITIEKNSFRTHNIPDTDSSNRSGELTHQPSQQPHAKYCDHPDFTGEETEGPAGYGTGPRLHGQ